MSKYKIIITLCLALCLFQVLNGEKRANPRPMSELTDPSSPSFVPYPYPKTREEVIADLKYAIKKMYINQEGKYESLLPGTQHITKRIKLNLLEDQCQYKIDRIVKAKLRQAGFAKDYYWILYILNKKDNSIAARIYMLAEGLLGGTAAYTPGEKPRFITTDQDVIDHLDNYPELAGAKKYIKHIDRVFWPSPLSSEFEPFWEIKMTDGNAYYYSYGDETVYRIKKEIPWKKDKDGRRPNHQDFVSDMNFAFDDIDDKILVFEKLQKKK